MSKKPNDKNPKYVINSLLKRIKEKGFDQDPQIKALLPSLVMGDQVDWAIKTMIEERLNVLETMHFFCPQVFDPVVPELTGLIHCGDIHDSEGNDQDFGFYPQELNDHLLVVGSSGSGKTSVAIHLLRQILSLYARYPGKPGGVALQVYDIKGDYKWLYKEFPDVWVLPLTKRTFNPLQVQDGVDPKAHAAFFTHLFCDSFYILDVRKNILLPTLHDLYQKFGVLNGSKIFPTLRQLKEQLEAQKVSSSQKRVNPW